MNQNTNIFDARLEDEGGIPNTEELATKLGLSPETVQTLLDMASEGGNEATLKAVDNALCAALAVISGVFEDLDRYADKAIAEADQALADVDVDKLLAEADELLAEMEESGE